MTRKKEKKAEDTFKCPFCFQSVNPENVAFRAKDVLKEQDRLSDPDNMDIKYLEKKDDIYEQFWRMYPGSEPVSEYAKHPVIDNAAPDCIHGVYQRDQSGFVYAVSYGKNKSSDIRICPHCHNTLPSGFGKYPVKYISIVGITSSGKTVYLSQLLRKLNKFFVKVGLTVRGMCDEVNDFVEKYKIEKNKPFFQGNPANSLMPPMAVNIINKNTKKEYTLVFYDIAGENCVKTGGMKKYGPFIRNSDGIILLVDPDQFTGSDNVYSPESVIKAMWEAFVSIDNEDGTSRVPLAATLSKSDMERDVLGYDTQIFSNINYQLPGNLEIPEDFFEITDMHVEDLFKQLDEEEAVILKNQLQESFPNHHYFAVSALNTQPIEKTGQDGGYYIIEEDPETVRVEEPVFWLLYKLGVLQAGKSGGRQQGKVGFRKSFKH